MKLGFIGTGTMGNPMSRCLIDGGHQLTVHDLRREATTNLCEMGAAWADSPRAVAEASEIVFTSLPGPVEMEQVVQDLSTGILFWTSVRPDLRRHHHQLAHRLPPGGRSLPRSRHRGAGRAGQRPSTQHDYYGRGRPGYL